MKTAKRILSIILCLSMVIGYFTFGISAEEGEKAVKVTDASTLAVGDRIIIANVDGDKVMSTSQGGNNRGETSATLSGDTITLTADMEVFELEAGVTNGTWALKAIGGVSDGYIYAASSSKNYLRTQATNNENGSWTIEIADGVASIVASGSNTRNVMQYNQSSSLFACYGSASQKGISIYKIETGSTDPEETDPNATEAPPRLPLRLPPKLPPSLWRQRSLLRLLVNLLIGAALT